MKSKVKSTRRWSGAAALLVCALLLADIPALFQDEQYSQAGQHYDLSGRVSRVADGDTFTLSGAGKRHTIRVASIDAPETEARDRPGQPFAQKSRKRLQQLIAQQQVRLICYEQDHYGRHVCDVPLACDDKVVCDEASADGQTTVSRVLVAEGLAWANMEKQGKFLRDQRLLDLQKQAQQASLGLWQDKDPVAPWAWRYHCWRQKQCN